MSPSRVYGSMCGRWLWLWWTMQGSWIEDRRGQDSCFVRRSQSINIFTWISPNLQLNLQLITLHTLTGQHVEEGGHRTAHGGFYIA
jgi:hypothetical protein